MGKRTIGVSRMHVVTSHVVTNLVLTGHVQ